MRFKLRARTLSHSLLVIFAISMNLGCGVMGTKNQPATPPPSDTGCLNNSKDLMSQYVRGKTSQTEWKHAFDCVNQSLGFFTDFVRGSSQDSYSQEDMYTLVSRFLITNRPVHQNLLLGAFSLKAALFGGSARTFTKDEIRLLKTSLERLRDITSDLIPYLALAQKTNPTSSELMEEVAAFKRAGEQLADFAGTLPTEMLTDKAVESLISELTLSLNLPAIENLSQTTFLTKWIVFNTRRDAIEPADWPQVFKTAMGFSGILLAYQAAVGSDLLAPKHQIAERLKNDPHFREFLYELALQAKPYFVEIIARHGGAIPYPLFDHLIDSLPADLFDSLPKQTLKQSLKPLLKKFLLASTSRGFDQGVLDTGYNLLGDIVRDLGQLDLFYERSGIDVADTKPAKFRQALNDYESSIPDARALAQFTDIKNKLLTYSPRFSKNTPSISFETKAGYSKLQGLVVLAMDRVAHHLQKAYGTGPDSSFVSEDLVTFFKDFTDILFALKVVDPTISNFGPKRLQDMDLFTPNGNGDGQASISEVVNYSMMIISAGELTNKMRSEITAKCTSQKGLDLMGWSWVQAPCFRQEFHARLGDWIQQFPHLKNYWATLSTEEQTQAMIWLEHGSRRNGYSDDDFGKFDFTAMATVLHYTETLFARFDQNTDDELDKDEIGEAYPVFKGLLAKKAKIDPSNDFMLKGIFTYIVKYRQMPETSGVGNVSKLAWWLTIYRNSGTQYSSDRAGVFNIVCQLANPESSSQAALTKTICQ